MTGLVCDLKCIFHAVKGDQRPDRTEAFLILRDIRIPRELIRSLSTNRTDEAELDRLCGLYLSSWLRGNAEARSAAGPNAVREVEDEEAV